MRSMTFYGLVLALLLFPSPLLTTELSGTEGAVKRPNILIMMADDMGITDASCYNGNAQTARIDRLANEGIRYTNFYSGASNGSPTRAAMLTGRTPSRVGVYDSLVADAPMRLPETEITIPKLLKPLGYDTAHFGKWHLATYNEKNTMLEGTPDKHGYDYWFGCANNAAPSHFQPNNYHRNGIRLKKDGYACQEVAAESIKWLRSRKNKEHPFFMTVWYNEPHVKLAAPENLIHKYMAAGFHQEALYYATIENMDIASGRILDVLDELKLRENTLVLFTSGNGPELFKTSSDPFRMKKLFLYEGGIRVPGIVRWPGHAEGGKISDVPIGFVDLLPTLVSIAGGTVPTDRTIDGENVLPALHGKPLVRTKPLFWYFYKFEPLCALRDGDYKITATTDDFANANTTKIWQFSQQNQVFIKSAKLTRFELYNLKNDPSETTDIAATEPEIFAALQEKIIAFHAEMIRESPEWEGLPSD